MQVWYYHSPGQGRIGPLSVEEIQQHYRERRMALDTLVWREGQREWQPAERLIEELGLMGMKPDPAQPPPMPPPGLSLGIVEIEDERFAQTDPKTGAPWPNAAQQTAPSAKAGLSGCLIAAIAVGVVGVVLLGILAAIALPAYNDFVKRTKQAQQAAADAAAKRPPTLGPPVVETVYDAQQLANDDARLRRLLVEAMGSSTLQAGRCPQEFEFESVQVRLPELSGRYDISLFSEDPYRCAYAVRFGPPGSEWASATAMYVAQGERGDISVSCRSNTTNAWLKPPGCN
jgi:GYF domain 2